MGKIIGYVDKSGSFHCAEHVQDKSVYEDNDSVVVLSSDDWKATVGLCADCGAFVGDLS